MLAAETRLQEEADGIVVVAIEVVQYAELVEDERPRRANLLRLPDVLQCEVQMVRAQVLHANPQPGDVRAWEEARRSAVRGHRLVRLVLRGERVAESDPRGGKTVVDRRRLRKVPTGVLEVVYHVVVATDSIPRHRRGGVLLHQLMRQIKELGLVVEPHLVTPCAGRAQR